MADFMQNPVHWLLCSLRKDVDDIDPISCKLTAKMGTCNNQVDKQVSQEVDRSTTRSTVDNSVGNKINKP